MTYVVRWTEVSKHEVTLTDEQFAAIKAVEVEELAELEEHEVWEDLEDQLAELEDDGFQVVTREITHVARH